MAEPTVTFLGGSAAVAPLGVGAWSWGDSSTWGMGTYDQDLSEATIAEAVDASVAAGVTLIDTAEGYGNGESERIIGRLMAADPVRRERLVIATKFIPMPWKLDVHGALRRSLEASLERLGTDRVELYQIHGPISLRSHKALAAALASVVKDGLTRAVGVSNYSVKEMTQMHRALGEHGVPLASNQIEFSLLRRRPETSGLIAACHELGVVPLAYSPIGQGRLTGKYSAASPPPGKRGFSAHPMEQVDAVVSVVRTIGEAHGRTPSQVALRWLVQKGGVPIPGAKNAGQAEQNAGALGWELSATDMATLDAAALEGTNSLANRIWQHG
ncbi:MAG: aldo/keto reductase [Actinomycetes bacterium]